MRLANGSGSVYKLSGNRRKPWRAVITTGWEFDPVLMKKNQIRQTLGFYATRNEALKALMDYNDNPFDLSIREITFDQCYQEAQKRFTEGRKGNYSAAYKYLKSIKDIPIRSIKANQMQKCIDSCTTTQQVEIKTVCHKVFDWAMQNDIIDKDPSRYLFSKSVKARKEKRVFSADEIQLIDSSLDWWNKIAMMLLYTGMRTKELRTLDPEDIDPIQGIINIRVAKNQSSVRQIPIHPHVYQIFCDYREHGCNLYGYTHDGLNEALKRIDGHTAHECRHTFTTQMRKCGCDPLVLQIILGHTPSSITERVYTHITLKEMALEISKLDYENKEDLS